MDRLSANKNKRNGNTTVALFCLLAFFIRLLPYSGFISSRRFLSATAMGHSTIHPYLLLRLKPLRIISAMLTYKWNPSVDKGGQLLFIRTLLTPKIYQEMHTETAKYFSEMNMYRMQLSKSYRIKAFGTARYKETVVKCPRKVTI